MTTRKVSPLRLALLGVLLAGVIAAVIWLPWQPIVDRVQGLGAWGPVALGAIYVLACALFVPGSPLTLAAGALFGLWLGTLTVVIAATLGATLAFLVGRYLARDWVSRLVEGKPRFAAVDRAVAEQGFRIVLLTRLSPVFPFNFLNFAFSVTRVSLRDYVLGSLLGMLPGTVLYVYLGSVLGDVAAGGERERTPAEWAFYGAGLLATIVATVLVTRVARRALGKAAPKATA
jgi:uncharacterized membrane protein YdjX (TVP38/TMEM64 family)